MFADAPRKGRWIHELSTGQERIVEKSIRRARHSEHSLVRSVVQTVVDETYGGLWAPPPLSIDEEDWSLAWVAIVGSEIIGMALTLEEWINDLWVLRPFRGIGVGSMLLVQAETEIMERRHRYARLRLVRSNTKTQTFYAQRGWLVQRELPHERLPIAMVEMAKSLRISN
jgi:ribosomal protein S18 acetylase RimI-like enzyme